MSSSWTAERPVVYAPGTFTPHTYHGGCHCGRLRFSCLAPPPEELELTSCNCSFCAARGALCIYVKAELFTWTKGSWADVTAYRWNTGRLAQSFCPTCGIHIGTEARGEVVSVNVRCLDDDQLDVDALPLRKFDGKNLVPVVNAPPAN